MLSDAISDAAHDIHRYLTDELWAKTYEWNRPRINALLKEMRRVRLMHDIKGTPRECLWPHVLPIRDLMDKEPPTEADHEELSKLIDALPGL